LFKALSPQARFYCGLAMLTADGLFLLTAIFLVLGGECWRFTPIFAPPLATDEGSTLFDAYIQEAAETDKAFAADRKRDFESLWNIASKAPDSKLENQKTLFMLWGAAAGRDDAQASVNRALVQTYRKKYDEAFAKKNAETVQRVQYRDGWILSILSSILLFFVGGAIGWAGLRVLRSAALPGTVFEKPSAASSKEDGRITNG
jgi:hypothetical protein